MIVISGRLTLKIICDICGTEECREVGISVNKTSDIEGQLFATVQGNFWVTHYIGSKKIKVRCVNCINKAVVD